MEIRQLTFYGKKSIQHNFIQHFRAMHLAAQINRQFIYTTTLVFEKKAHNTDSHVRHRGGDVAKSRALVPSGGLITHLHIDRGTTHKNNARKSSRNENDDISELATPYNFTLTVNMISTCKSTPNKKYEEFLLAHSRYRGKTEHYSHMTAKFAKQLDLDPFELWTDEEWQHAVRGDWGRHQSSTHAVDISSAFSSDRVTELAKSDNMPSDLRVTTCRSGIEEPETRVIYLNANKSDYAPQPIDIKHRLPFVTMTIFMDTTQSGDSTSPS